MPLLLVSEASIVASETLFVLALVVIVGPLLAEKARLPGLIGFMVGGILLGPYGFGFLAAGQFDAFGGLGILYLMFLAGLELDMDIFNRYRKAAGQFGLISFIAPFALAWWVGTLLDYSNASSLLLGTLWASHTLVALPIVKRAGLSGSRSVAVAAGATIITDTLALVLLGIIGSGATEAGAGGGGTILRLVAGLAVLVGVTLWVYPRVGKWFFGGPGTDRTVRFMFLIGGMALAGLISEWGGIEGIVGAFFAGLGLNRLVPKKSNLMEKVEFIGSSLFIPAFLIMVGMLIDPSLLLDVSTLTLTGAFLLIVAVGKSLGAAIGGALFKFSLAEIGLLFSLTIGQAAATLATSLVGVNIGLFDDRILNAAVSTLLIMTLVTSVLTRLFSGLVKPEKTIDRPVGSAVIVPTPPGSDSEALLNLAGQIALADSGTVTPLMVIPAEDATHESTEGTEQLAAEAALAASSSGTEAEGLVRVDSSVKSAVLNVVAEKRASLLVLRAPNGSKLSQLVFGGPIESIGGESPVPVALAAKVDEEPQRLVVVVPGRPRTLGDQVDSQVALDITRNLAESLDLAVLALIGPGGVVPDLPEDSTIHHMPKLNIALISESIHPGDLLITPLASVRRFLSSRARGARLPNEAGLLITAGPFRLRSDASAPEEVASVFGYVGS